MSCSEPAQVSARRTRLPILAALAIASTALVGVLGHQSLAALSTSTPSLIASEPPTHRPDDTPHGHHSGALGEADGVVPDGVTVFDDEFPAVANLDPDLLGALREAATDAASDRVEFYVNSGWRSPKYQDQLLREAISTYGSAEEAARWVASPETSAHVSGDAIDIGPSDTTAWLSAHGARYGLCQIYDDEPWHYELRPEARESGCPARYADATQDPRTQQ